MNYKVKIALSITVSLVMIALAVTLVFSTKGNFNKYRQESNKKWEALMSIGDVRYGTIIQLYYDNSRYSSNLKGFKVAYEDLSYEDVTPTIMYKPSTFKIGKQVAVFNVDKVTKVPDELVSLVGIDVIAGNYLAIQTDNKFEE